MEDEIDDHGDHDDLMIMNMDMQVNVFELTGLSEGFTTFTMINYASRACRLYFIANRCNCN